MKIHFYRPIHCCPAIGPALQIQIIHSLMPFGVGIRGARVAQNGVRGQSIIAINGGGCPTGHWVTEGPRLGAIGSLLYSPSGGLTNGNKLLFL